MARTGRPRKPTEQKRLTGNPGHRPLPSSTQLAVVAPLPVTMADDTPLDAFDALMVEGVAWLGRTDAPTVTLAREYLEERQELRQRALDGSTEARRELRDLERLLLPLLGQLGFDPAARARLGLAEVKAASKLEAIRVSQDRRMAPKVAQQDNAG